MMHQRLTPLIIRGRWCLILLFGLLFVLALIYGVDAPRSLILGGFEDRSRESSEAARRLEQELNLGNPDVLVVIQGAHPLEDEPERKDLVVELVDTLRRQPGVLRVTSPAGPHPDALLSIDGRLAAIVVELEGDETTKQRHFEAIAGCIRSADINVLIGGTVAGGLEAQRDAMRDLTRAELVTLPLLALLLVVFFRGVVVATLPLIVGAFAIVSTLALLRLLSQVTEVSIFALNIVTIIGLGVSVDYALFMVQRFRDELDAGRSVDVAVAETLRTAGRTVAFSGVAVAASLLGLLVFPITLLRSVAVGGTLVVLVAMVASTLFLPALLSVLGRRVDWLSLRRSGPRTGGAFWHRVATLVMRAPVLVTVVVSTGLLLLGVPFLSIETSVSDIRILPPSSEVRRIQELLEAPGTFPPNELTPIIIFVELDAPVLSPEGITSLQRYVKRLAASPGVLRIDSVVSGDRGEALAAAVSLGGVFSLTKAPPEAITALRRAVSGQITVISVVGEAPPTTSGATALVERLRAVPLTGGQSLVGGATAKILDLRASLGDHLPTALVLVCAATFLVLFFAFGSLIVPLKAIVMNALSLSASFGALVWVFQAGRFEWLLDYTSPGNIELTIPVVMFSVVFGLSMDYELFLLSRIKEEWDRSGDTHASVSLGLERTARIITSAAALLVVVMIGFITADMILIKELGLGMALAIAIDATIVRALLVPASMQLLGRLNWWAPGPLSRLWRWTGLGIDERAAPSQERGASQAVPRRDEVGVDASSKGGTG